MSSSSSAPPDPDTGIIPDAMRLPADDVLRRKVKAEMRKRLRGLRKTTPASACSERSAQIVARLEELEPLLSAKTVALFWPMEDRHEVDLRSFDEWLRARGVRVAYPTVLDSGEMIFIFVDDVRRMTAHALGFSAPALSLADDAKADALDVIVVPALAIDPTGHRIGYGAGFYDRALSVRPASTSVGVAFDFQLISEAPATETDVRVHWIVTDRRVLRASDEAAFPTPSGEPWAT
jgi:5-formyltetrahydrofolate cyclo-ligase